MYRLFWCPTFLRLAERYNVGNVGTTASMSMLTMSMLTLFESRYTLNNQPVKDSAY